MCERMCVSAIFLFCDFNLSIVRHGEQTNDSRLEMPPRQTKRAKGRSGAVRLGGQAGAGQVQWTRTPRDARLLFLINLL